MVDLVAVVMPNKVKKVRSPGVDGTGGGGGGGATQQNTDPGTVVMVEADGKIRYPA